MHEKLVSYLLGGLSPTEAEQLRRRLADDPELAAELERIRECLPTSEDGDEQPQPSKPVDTPRGLADRTADSVSMLASELARRDNKPVEVANDEIDEVGRRRCSITLLDAAVAVGVVAAVGMMLVPALRESREAARRIACQNNLRELGQTLALYADDHNGYFPIIHPNANAGSFAITLADGGYRSREELAELVVCAASREAGLVESGQLVVRVPTWGELNQAAGQQLAMLRRTMSLSFAYRLPYVKNNRYVSLRRECGVRSPLLSDAPTVVDNQWRSLNHGGCGQNVLFNDGSVDYVSDCRAPKARDHLFVNTAGRPEAPTEWNDAVLVRSEFAPRFSPPPRMVVHLRGAIKTRVRVTPRSSAEID